jgi:predicted amidohydrolase
MPNQVGTLAVDAWGDAVVFELREGEFQLVDSHGEVRNGKQNLVPVTVVKGGRVYRQNAL